MKKLIAGVTSTIIAMTFAQFTLAGAHLTPPASDDPPGGEVHMAYESDTYTPGENREHLPGAHLAAPGDIYRFTLIRDDQYANDPNYEIVYAVAGVHIDDYDWQQGAKDSEPEWGEILINGKAMTTLIEIPGDKRAPESSALLEIISDAEVSKLNGPLMPPYIFDVTELAKKGKWLTFNVTNVRQNGSTAAEDTAPFGGFVVNRIGYHVWYKKKTNEAP